MTMQTTKLCACGCGLPLPRAATSAQKYIDRSHQLAARSVPRDAASRTLTVVRRELVQANDEIERLNKLLDRFRFIKPEDTIVPSWLKTPTGRHAAHHATPVFMLSDLHLDEVVDKYEMDGMNEYNRAIAERRVEQLVYGVVKLLKRFVSGVELDGLFLAVLGDIITGMIHDELALTNEATPSESIVHWVPLLASAIKFLADELDIPIFVAAVDGNHDRFFKRTPFKQRATSSLAWIIYNWLADHLRDDDRITFSLTVSPEQVVPVYDTNLLLSHGDSFRSAGGVGGIYPSMLKWLHRRHEMWSAQKRDFDYWLGGHWHQKLSGPDFFVNSSVKGYDEYAKGNGFKYELPSQWLFLLTPERGLTQQLPVFAD